jgi:hypothetical protein
MIDDGEQTEPELTGIDVVWEKEAATQTDAIETADAATEDDEEDIIASIFLNY